MVNYFQLQFEYGVGGYAHIETSETLDVHFFTGHSLKAGFPSTTVSLKSRPRAPDCIGVGSLDLVSERLRDFLIEEKVNAEFLSVEVRQDGCRTDRAYYEMNILDVIACFDRQRSVFQEFPPAAGGGILGIDQLYLDEQKIQGKRLFVMDERPLRLVREDLAEAIRAKRFSGLALKPLPNGPF